MTKKQRKNKTTQNSEVRLIVNSFMTDKQSNRSICALAGEALTRVPGLRCVRLVGGGGRGGIICRLAVLTLPSVEDVD